MKLNLIKKIHINELTITILSNGYIIYYYLIDKTN